MQRYFKQIVSPRMRNTDHNLTRHWIAHWRARASIDTCGYTHTLLWSFSFSGINELLSILLGLCFPIRTRFLLIIYTASRGHECIRKHINAHTHLCAHTHRVTVAQSLTCASYRSNFTKSNIIRQLPKSWPSAKRLNSDSLAVAIALGSAQGR